MSSLTWGQVVDSFNPAIEVPKLRVGSSTLECALEYANAGWYVLPVLPATKHAGSVLGKGWQDKSSRNPEVIKSWFLSSSNDLALHVGKSGALVLDVDDPEQLTNDLIKIITDPQVPFQSTRINGNPLRGHYVFSTPPKVKFGNSLGELSRGWGDVRGENGIICVYPSRHSKPDGAYRWVRQGPLPTIPFSLASKLRRLTREYKPSLSSKEAVSFITKNSKDEFAELLETRLAYIRKNTPMSGGRHTFYQSAICLALKDSACGFYPAERALNKIEDTFNACKPIEEQTSSEFEGMALWAIAQISEITLEEKAIHTFRNAPHLCADIAKWVQSHGN
jgi:hypothetical protein